MDFSWLNCKGENGKKIRYIIVIGLVAFIFLLISSLSSWVSSKKQLSSPLPEVTERSKQNIGSTSGSYPEELEEKLKGILKQIHGVGDVNVMVKYVSGPETVYAYNSTTENRVTEEKDTSGGIRTINEQRDANNLVLVQDSRAAEDQPVVVKKIEPEINGVLIVAEGAELSTVRVQLVRAAQTVLNIPSYKINVLPKER